MMLPDLSVPMRSMIPLNWSSERAPSPKASLVSVCRSKGDMVRSASENGGGCVKTPTLGVASDGQAKGGHTFVKRREGLL